MDKYIVVIPVFNSSELFYCETLEQVKQKIEYLTESEQDALKVRIFEAKEINVKSLFGERAGRNIKINVTDDTPIKLKFKNCLCCNQATLTSEIHDICSKCWWQDDPNSWFDIDSPSPANGELTLRQARLNYEKYGNCDGFDE